MQGPAPLEEPLSYPGERPRAPFLLRGDVVEPLPPSFDVRSFRARSRRAVLATGSNASPAKLAVKFRDRGCGTEVVGLIVDVEALIVRPSAHFGRSGYWPFAPARLDGTGTTCVLTLLDEDQVAVLDRTEPNYRRILLDPGVHRVRPRDASRVEPVGAVEVGAVEVYESLHGVVVDDRLPAWTEPPPSQQTLLTALIRATGDELSDRDPATLSDAVRRQPERADAVTTAVRRHLRVRASGLATRDRDEIGQDERPCGRLTTPDPSER